MTRCAYTEFRLRALLDGELEPAEHARVLAHLDSCGHCSETFAQMHAVSSMLQELPADDVPDHFTTSLQVRLARHRAERAAAKEKRAWFRLPSLSWPQPRLRLAGGLTTVCALALGVFLVSQGSRASRASEVARRAQLSWAQIRNYGCVFESQGVYQGQTRTFTQQQFYRKPGDFRLDTSQDYRLTTYVMADRIIHYLPGGRWEGTGPLCIIRPRVDDRGALPFPFGVTWHNGGNVSLDQLIRQLNRNDDAELVGTEKVRDRECYRVRFTSVPPGGSERDQYELWVDTESFLPRRVSWYRDPQNHIVTEARNLQVNYDVLPAGTFEFPIPNGARVIEGDVDPHVLAMPFLPARTDEFDVQPVSTAREEAWQRSLAVPFPVMMPEYLPDGFHLIRVRRKLGRWVDAHWIRAEDANTSQIVKLIEQDARESWTEPVGAVAVNLGTARNPVPGWLVQGEKPYRYAYLTWQRGATRCTLFTSGMERSDVEKIARSMTEVTAPSRPLVADHSVRRRVRSKSEPSELPTDTASEQSADMRITALEPPVETTAEPPPMMPEMSDEDRSMATTGKEPPAVMGPPAPR